MKRLVPLLLLVLVLSACKIRLDAAVVINEDESGTLALEISADSELRALADDQGGADFTAIDDIPDGWTVEEFTDGDFEGARVSTSFGSLDEFQQRLSEYATSAAPSDNVSLDFITQLELSREGDLFNFRADLTGLEAGLGAALGGGGDTGGINPGAFLAELFEIRIVLTLPGTIVSSNADATAQNTLTWNLSVLDDGEILLAQSDLGAAGDGRPIIGLIVLVVVVAAVILVMVQRRNQRRESEMADADAP